MAPFTYRAAVSTALTGFRLIRRQPLTTLGWGLFSVITFAALFAAVAAMAGTAFIQLFRLVGDSPNMAPTPDQSMAILGVMGSVMGGYAIMIVGGLALSSVLGCAVFRAVLEPDHRGFAYLRFGRTELLMILVAIAAYVIYFLATLPIGMAIGIVMAVVSVSQGGVTPELMRVQMWVTNIIVYPVALLIAARFCLAFPMSFAEHRFRLMESWTLTRGHTLQMALMIVVQFVAQYLVMAPFILVIVAAALYYRIPLSLDGLEQLSHMTLQQAFNRFWPVGAVAVILGGPIWGILAGCYYGPFAEAYRRLRPEAADAFT